MAKDKMMTIRTEEEVHKQIKIRATELGISIADYIEQLVKEDLKKIKEEQIINEYVIAE